MDDEGVNKIILCLSRTLKAAELNYFITEKEMLAVVWALKKLRMYLLGAHTIVRTDHQAIKFFNRCRFANNRLTRWILFTQNYDIEYDFLPGKQNSAADLLSRNYEDYELSKKDDFVSIMAVFMAEPDSNLVKKMKNFKNLQKEDLILSKIVTKIHTSKYANRYTILNGILIKKAGKLQKIILPAELAKELVMELHNMYCHVGARKIFRMINDEFFVRNLRRKVQQWLHTCDVCQRVKYHQITGDAPLQAIIPEKPNELLSIDFLGPLANAAMGFKHILVCIDVFSKYVTLYPLKRATTEATINKIFNDYIPNNGKIEKIQSDHGSQFTSDKWIKKLEKEKIKPVFSSIRHPQSNIVERVNKELGRFFRTLIGENHGAWLRYLNLIQRCINETHHETTDVTPMELHLGMKPTRFWTNILGVNLQNPTILHEKQIVLARERIS